jgi:hypothetical protein
MVAVEEDAPSFFTPGSGNIALGIAIVVFMTIALYNALELSLLIPLSFRRYRSLYFWSLLTSATLGVIPATIGPVLQFFSLAPLWLSLFLSNLGFVMMVPNQSVVLYSRLHLVSQDTNILRAVRWLIFASLFVIIPTITTNVGDAYLPHNRKWSRSFQVLERFQVTWFAVQEMIISSIYIYDTIRMMRLSPETDKRRNKILYELLAVNVTAILMDLTLVVLEYVGFYFTQVIFKAAVYSIKLKLEFAVLGMLVSIVHSRGSWQADCDTSMLS